MKTLSHRAFALGLIACAAIVAVAFLAGMDPVSAHTGMVMAVAGAAAVDPEALAKMIRDNHEATKGALEAASTKIGGVEAELLDLHQKLARRNYGAGGHVADQTWGEQFANAPEVKSFAGDTTRPGRVRLEMKSTITSAPGSGGDLVAPQRDLMVGMPQRRMMVRDLMPVVRVTQSGSVEFPRQTTRTNNAAPVAEAAVKPESAYAFELKEAPIRTIAHWVPASRQIVDDAPQLMGLIDTELRYGLALKEEAQMLNGDGTGQNLLGLIPQATAFSPAFALTSPTMIDMLGLAILQCALADLPADGVVIHPADWMRMRLLKNADGDYILGDPTKNIQAVLFGVPIVPTAAMTIDKFLVGNYQSAATVYDRWSTRVEVSTEHADFFVRNLVAVLAEERVGLAVKQPTALTYGDFGNVT